MTTLFKNVQYKSKFFSDMYNIALSEQSFIGLIPEVIKVEVEDDSPSI